MAAASSDAEILDGLIGAGRQGREGDDHDGGGAGDDAGGAFMPSATACSVLLAELMQEADDVRA
jgi:hypothetical protein